MKVIKSSRLRSKPCVPIKKYNNNFFDVYRIFWLTKSNAKPDRRFSLDLFLKRLFNLFEVKKERFNDAVDTGSFATIDIKHQMFKKSPSM